MTPQPAPAPTSGLQLLLLGLLSPCRSVRQSDLDALDDTRWTQLEAMVRQHRLGPLLAWQLAHAHAQLVLPAAVSARLAQAARQAAFRSLLLQQELIDIHRILTTAAIPYQALKGAFLAFHAYPSPGLRPMRDLDILVPNAQSAAAYEALQDAGLRRMPEMPVPPEVESGAHCHLAPLLARCGQFAVELHTRLFHFHERDPHSRVDPSDEPDFWQRGRQARLGSEQVSFDAPEDLLLHLIVHAVYDHEFNNGPLILSDVAFLLQRHELDWALFWARAQATGRTRGCHLVLHLVRRYWGLQPADMTGSTPPSEQELDAFATLMLCDPAGIQDRYLHSDATRQRSAAEWIRFFLDRAFTSPARVRLAYDLPMGDWRVVFYYPVRWYRQLTTQLPKLWRARGSEPPQSADLRQLGALRHWLESPR